MVEERLESQLMLINEVRKRPALWDSRLPFFGSVPLQAKQWKNVGIALNISATVASETWNKIRKVYEKNRTQDSSFLAGRPARSLAKRWLFMDSLNFLDPVVVRNSSRTVLYSPTDAVDSDVVLSEDEYHPSLPSINTVSMGSSPFVGGLDSSGQEEYVPKSPDPISTNSNVDVDKLCVMVSKLQDATDVFQKTLEALQNIEDSVKVYANHIAAELKNIDDPATLALAKYKIANVLYEAKISALTNRG